MVSGADRDGRSRVHNQSTQVSAMLSTQDADNVRAARVILASGSPRRVEILNDILGLQATVVPSTFLEDLDKSKYTPKEYVMENARQKALEVYERLVSENQTPSLVVGADTVVVVGDAILEKPKSAGAL